LLYLRKRAANEVAICRIEMTNFIDYWIQITDHFLFFLKFLYFYKQLTLSSIFIFTFIYRHRCDTSVTRTFFTFSLCS
jgi:hypothetical protein